MARYNTSEGPKVITVDELLAIVGGAKFSGNKGAQAFLRVAKKQPAFAKGAVTIINAGLAKKHAADLAAKAAATPATTVAATSGELSDHEAWGMLANLVDSALAELSADERSALKAAFREEARKAA